MTIQFFFTGKLKIALFLWSKMEKTQSQSTQKKRFSYSLFIRQFDAKLFLSSIPFVWQSLFFYTPLIFLFFRSFLDRATHSHFSVQNFIDVSSPAFFRIIAHSLQLAVSTAVISLLIAFPLAFFISSLKSTFKKTSLLLLLLIPFWSNFLLHIYAWFFILERGGLLNAALMYLQVINEPYHFLNTHFSVMIMMVYYYMPLTALPLYSAIERFNSSLLEASDNLGAHYFQTLYHVILPNLLPSIRAAFFIVFIPSFGEFIIPEFMGGEITFYVGSVISHLALGNTTFELGTAFTIISMLALIVSCTSIAYLFKIVENFFKKKGASV